LIRFILNPDRARARRARCWRRSLFLRTSRRRRSILDTRAVVLTMERARHHDVATVLIARLEGAGDARVVAERMVANWRALDDALSPILGAMGVAALYARAIHLSMATHPWLKGAVRSVAPRIDVGALTRLLAEQDVMHASAASATLLYHFCDVLAGLIGSSLTSRLLTDAFDPSRTRSPAPDSQP
jgi:hypothetical protein